LLTYVLTYACIARKKPVNAVGMKLRLERKDVWNVLWYAYIHTYISTYIYIRTYAQV